MDEQLKSRSIGIKWWVDRTTEGDWDENEIKTMFSPCGPVEEVMLMGPGTAYLRFHINAAMPKALEMHNTTYTGGRRNRPGKLEVYAGGKVPGGSYGWPPPNSRPPPTLESNDEDQGPPLAPSLRRVCGGKGWVVHGLLFEYSDGVRTGFFAENELSWNGVGKPLELDDDAGILRREGVWQDVFPGEELVSISGHNSTMGYLCGSISVHLSSGRVIEYKGDNASMFGPTFTHDAVASPGGYHEPIFKYGRCDELKAIATPPKY